MGLTASSTGLQAVDQGTHVCRNSPEDRVVALVGNPNVGKSTVFNELTGMNQHTGNWPGKTVASAQGAYEHEGTRYILVDLPGCYSLLAHSAEEEVARDFLCFGGADAAVVVCDATCLERNLNLVLQTLEITRNVVVCVNLMDEARKKQIHVDTAALSRLLGVPVVGASARSREGLDALVCAVARAAREADAAAQPAPPVRYAPALERAAGAVEGALAGVLPRTLSHRWAALRLLEGEPGLLRTLDDWLGYPLLEQPGVGEAVRRAQAALEAEAGGAAAWKDGMVAAIYAAAEDMAARAVRFLDAHYNERQLKIDRILTGRWTGLPIMLLLLCVVFWLTISGANVPSQLLADGLFWVQDQLTLLFERLRAPEWLHGALVLGVYRVLAWVISVMLPPMAIFFPLFTLLEDLGYLPRVAFNLDRPLKRCCACGKQALTMCMVFTILQ